MKGLRFASAWFMGVALLWSTSLFAVKTETLSHIDRLYDTRDTIGNIEIALKVMEDTCGNDLSTASYDILWRYARAASGAPDYVEGSKKKKMAILKKGIRSGRQAKKLNPQGIDGIYWYAIARANA